MLLKDGKIPLRWWNKSPNFGDLLAPWLVAKMSGKEVYHASAKEPHYLTIGSILYKTASNKSIVWGSGCFGTETTNMSPAKTKFLAVRGPLTRNKIVTHGGVCPRIYGDPALLVPEYYFPKVDKKYELGVILRWSEKKWLDMELPQGMKKINFGASDIEGTLDDILACERVASSSLHGLIIADAYGIPSIWIDSDSPQGTEFKFHDYFLSVDKQRQPMPFEDVLKYPKSFRYDDRDIMSKNDCSALLDVCPFLSP